MRDAEPLVVDSSALVELLLGGTRGQQVLAAVRPSAENLHSPHLALTESLSVLRSLELRHEISSDRARSTVALLRDFPVRYWDLLPLTLRVWSLRGNLTAYDATYVALAEALNAPLVTCDQRLAAAPALPVRVLACG